MSLPTEIQIATKPLIKWEQGKMLPFRSAMRTLVLEGDCIIYVRWSLIPGYHQHLEMGLGDPSRYEDPTYLSLQGKDMSKDLSKEWDNAMQIFDNVHLHNHPILSFVDLLNEQA